MAYQKLTWQEGVTALSANNMNNIENGIQENKEKIDLIGMIYTETVTRNENPIEINVGNSNYVTVCTLELPAGVYIITGHLRWNSIQAGRVSIFVGTSQRPGAEIDGNNAQHITTSNLLNLAQQTMAIVELNNSTNINLVGYADHDSTISHGILKAVKIK